MSGSNFNITSNPALPTNNWRYFTKEADLPAPVAGVITLEANTTYVLFNDDPSASQKQVDIANRLKIPDAGGVRITGVGLATAILNYTGTAAFITTSNTYTGFLGVDNLFVSCPNGTFLDIDGVLPVGQEFFPRIFLNNMGLFNTDTIGTIKNISVNFNVGAFFDCKQGLVMDGVKEFLVSDWRFSNWQNVVGAIMITAKGQLRFPKFQNCTFETNVNETVFNISPSIGDETFVIGGNSYRGAGNLYATGTSGTIASIADAASSGSVTAVSGTPFGECIMTDVAHGLTLGQTITTSGFADSNYNGTFEVLEIIDADNFRIHTLFTATGTGSWNSDVIAVTTTLAHGLVTGDGVQITDTIFANDYNGGALILITSTFIFQINRVFNGTDTGNWNTDSLTESDPRMRIVGNAGIPDSRSLAFGEINANTSVSAVTDGAYTNVVFSGFTANVVTERWVLTNATNGVFTYVGAESFVGKMVAAINAIKTGGVANYRFAVSINGATPVFATTMFAPMEIGSTKASTGLIAPINIVNGDTVQLMIAGDGTGTDATVTDLVIEISG